LIRTSCIHELLQQLHWWVAPLQSNPDSEPLMGRQFDFCIVRHSLCPSSRYRTSDEWIASTILDDLILNVDIGKQEDISLCTTRPSLRYPHLATVALWNLFRTSVIFIGQFGCSLGSIIIPIKLSCYYPSLSVFLNANTLLSSILRIYLPGFSF
jgi:hypothetical protein